jgi:hypothetical protein
MSDESASEIFCRVVQGVNMMTPEREGYYRLGKNSAAELSSGRGIEDEPIYGVTVVWDGVHRHDLGRLFHRRAQAFAYINSLLDPREETTTK